MKRYSFIFISLFLLLGLNQAVAAETIVLQECLVLKLPEMYYRTPLGIDPIEARVVQKGLYRPSAGERIEFPDGSKSRWEKAKADSLGWIEHASLENGYAYFSWNSPVAQRMILEGMGHDMVYVNGVPRAGNRYQYKDVWEAWEPRFDYSLIPIQLNAGRNDLLFLCSRSGKLKVKLHPVTLPVFFNTNDLTLPDLIVKETVDCAAAIVVVNTTERVLDNLQVVATLTGSRPCTTNVSLVQPQSVRKIAFAIRGAAPREKGEVKVDLHLFEALPDGDRMLDSTLVKVPVKSSEEPRRITFVSEVDGSIQYYALNPAREASAEPRALVFSVHGAGVDALNQATSYSAKTWADIVCPTNRRPYGFNWEDWGRIDALEVLDRVMKSRSIDPQRIYLTGHSMGGHGTWILGALYPGRFAAIGPSAGWLSFWSYRVREDMKNDTPMQQLMRRVTLPSRTLELSPNYGALGIYILHGVDDDNVLVEQSRHMVENLKTFHHDFVYWEQPHAGHWWDVSPEPGADCVDWPPMFDFFARHVRPPSDRVRIVEFITPDPGISSQCDWLAIEAQTRPLMMSSVKMTVYPGLNRLEGVTDNVSRLSFNLESLPLRSPCTVVVDSQKVENISWMPKETKIWIERNDGKWKQGSLPSTDLKGPQRYGTFKDVFRHHMVFVFGTQGTEGENRWAFAKARYDAEVFWYQGNGSVEVVADKEFDPDRELDRNVILYGNRDTNSAWNQLLSESPVVFARGMVQIGGRKLTGTDYGGLFIRPRPGSETACVGAVTGTGLPGMRLTLNRPYLAPGYAFPDVTIFDREVVEHGTDGITCAGFFGADWSLEKGEMVWKQ